MQAISDESYVTNSAVHESDANSASHVSGSEASSQSGHVSDSGLARLGNPEAEPATMDRVIDVPLTVTLRFGQRQMTLRELLDLNTGSLVELDQQVEEPVHLMLGERVIARGEVVIVDGNYGMRVLEVVDHPAAQRLSAVSTR